ncbi:hypothetical protein EYF80_017264 [Liparis tanakae]|uniref:Uncharacterized protein n=1 Tax=Liparis tanakae TaxID=230148 RepID=A0A4Z2I3H1_9TELE|nr:hypothetical protein EYF80_017264 [Liparis tanakae]
MSLKAKSSEHVILKHVNKGPPLSHSGQDQPPVGGGPLVQTCLWLPHLCKQERPEQPASAQC